MYKAMNGTTIIRIADGASIPTDPANKDYAEYLAWVEQGNVPEPADPVIAPEPRPTIQDIIDVLPQASKDALTAKISEVSVSLQAAKI